MAPATRLQRKRKHDLRQMVDAILWLLRTGCQWRYLSPNWSSLAGRLTIPAPAARFDQWKAKGTFEQMNAALNQLDRVNAKREAYPLSIMY